MIELIDGFDWDDANIGKCQKHGISVQMIEAFSGVICGYIPISHIRIRKKDLSRSAEWKMEGQHL